MTNLRCIALYVIAFLAACLGHGLLGSAQQEPQSDEREEAERLIALLQVPKIRETDPDGVTEAIRRLGRIGDERAVPILAEYLDFKRPPTDYEKAGLKLAATMVPFPARDALNRIGRAGTEAVIKVIRQHGIESPGGKNAFWVLHYYYSDSLRELLELIEQEASSAPEEEAQHLREAIARYRQLMERH
ncbi:MAG: hypothetical protein V3T83_03230 [Acidobacteriota bacterium]